MDSYPTTGPLGSTDRSNEETLYGELRAGDSSQRGSWREGDIKERARTLGLPSGGAKLFRYGRIALSTLTESRLRKILRGGKLNIAYTLIFIFRSANSVTDIV